MEFIRGRMTIPICSRFCAGDKTTFSTLTCLPQIRIRIRRCLTEFYLSVIQQAHHDHSPCNVAQSCSSQPGTVIRKCDASSKNRREDFAAVCNTVRELPQP